MRSFGLLTAFATFDGHISPLESPAEVLRIYSPRPAASSLVSAERCSSITHKMEPIATAITAIHLAYKLGRTGRFIYPAWEVLSFRRLRKNYDNLKQKFGTLQASVLIIIFPDAKQIVDRVEKHVLGAETDEAILLRKLTSEDCTMLAVAAAIVAQVAITALALEDLDKVHWTAKAAFVLSLTAGGLSVFYACLVQQRMSNLFTTDDVKNFFSKPSSPEEFRFLEQRLDDLTSDMRERSPADESIERHQKMIELESMIKQFKSKNKWKCASFHSILMVKAPTLLLKYALASFIIGLGIYFGCLAFSYVDPQKPRGSHRAIFIVYIVTSFLSLLIYYVPSILKELELSPARRYAQIMTDEVPKQQHQEEKELILKISALLNSEEQEANGEYISDDAASWAGRLEDMNRPRPQSRAWHTDSTVQQEC
ncbi:hypothetical protein PENNAL_c0001G09431 [Penicillium nalgiovense]|uniref:Uncharacterized protein n=1 Tax=Penicillium nalgiovense TaxID=60175 RepID=A0A1V6Z919_PENNA|nr:hypothetical protein PENNAL_c0001G09431 [Penicillium nalgiovense]